MRVFETGINYLVNLPLNTPQGKIEKPIMAQFKENVSNNGDSYARFSYVNKYFEITDETFLINKKQLTSFCDKCCTL